MSDRNVNRGVYRGRYVYTGGTWVRPSAYWWPVGGAIAAGAAIGFLTATAAVAYAGASPGPEYCWYYTDSSRQQGQMPIVDRSAQIGFVKGCIGNDAAFSHRTIPRRMPHTAFIRPTK